MTLVNNLFKFQIIRRLNDAPDYDKWLKSNKFNYPLEKRKE